MAKIEEIEGIGLSMQRSLWKLVSRLLMICLMLGTRKGRKELTEKTGISEKLILEWVNLADFLESKE